ncbi:hypothetical protein [Geobacter sp.]|uniref:hypothetical protein n=1 Tax=Geobacter sp. TaxID=46610 RepID=UPI0027B92680|nr:hypothetical protein [Geobacter sp.]
MKKVILVAAMAMVMVTGVGAVQAEEAAEVPAGYEEMGPPISAMMKPDKGIFENSVSFFKEAAGSVNPEFTGRFYLRGGQFSQKMKDFKHSIPFGGLGAEGDISVFKSLKLMGKLEGDSSFENTDGYKSFSIEGGAGVDLVPFVPFLSEVYSSMVPFYSFGHKLSFFNKKQDDYIFDEDRPFESRWDISYHRLGLKTSTNVGGWSIGLNGGMIMPTRVKNVEAGQVEYMVGEEIRVRNITRTPKIEAKNSYFGGLDVKKGRFVGGLQYEGLRFDTTTGGETSSEKNDTFTLKVGWEF